MTSNVSQVLGVLGRDVLGFHAKVKDLQGGLNRVKLALAGALAIGAGVEMAAQFKAPIEKAMEFEQVVARFRQFGLGSKLNDDAVAFAKNMNIAGASYTDAMRNMIEAQGVFRESGLAGPEALRGAKLSAPVLAKIDFANRILDPDHVGSRHVAGLDMLRFIEMKGGVNDPRLFNALADQGYKAIQSSGGNVNWSLYRQFMANGGVAARGLSNDALFGQMEPVIGELKSRAGTALMTSFNRLTGITRVPNQVAHNLVNAGIWDGSKIQWNAMGGIKAMTGNPLKDKEMFASSQFDWYQKYVMPMYRAQNMTPADMARMDAQIGGRTGGMMFSLFRTQEGPIRASLAAQRKAMGIDDSYKAAKGTTAGKFADAQAKFNNLMIEAGSAILPLVNRALAYLLPMMKGLADWMGRNSAVVKGVMVSIGVLTAGLVVAGAAALAMAAGPVALWTAGVALAGSALAGLITWIGGWNVVMSALKFTLDMFIHPFTNFAEMIGKIAGFLGFGGGTVPSQTPPKPIGSPPKAQVVQVDSNVWLNGDKVGRSMTRHFISLNNRPQPGGTQFDPFATYPQAATGH